MTLFTKTSVSVALAVALVLAACGGGGGGNTANPVVTPTPTQTATPTPTPSSVPTATPTSVGLTLADFPPVANNAPPGASAQAQSLATQIGKGVNFGNMFDAPREGDWGPGVRDDFIDGAATAGFKSVRLPVRWSNHADPVTHVIDPVFMARVESIVDKLLAKNLIVVMDMHHFRQFDGDSLDDKEFPVAADVVDLRFLSMWNQIADRFKGKSDKLAFELYNEPHGRFNTNPGLWNDLAARALGAVRRSNPTRVVVIGPVFWNSASYLSALKMPNDANLMSTVHSYEPFNFTHQGAEWINPGLPLGVTCCDANQQATVRNILNTAQTWASTKSYPVFIGEFGAYNKAPDASRLAYNKFMAGQAASRSMSWTYWEFSSGFGVYEPDTKTFRQTLLDSLLVP
jgi:endoglucanase